MKATLEHDIVTSTIQFSINNNRIIYSIPERLTKIIELKDYNDGFITMRTNYGEEYTDLIELLEIIPYSDKFKDKFISNLSNLKLKDIHLKGVN